MNFNLSKNYDVIIIGTGIGGGTIGYSLAKKGKKVLFVDKGLNTHLSKKSIKGNYAELLFNGDNNNLVLKNSGRYFDKIIDNTAKIPFLGSGTGGSSALYGMAMERFFPIDFEKRASSTNYINNSNLPSEGWPFKYDDLLPYYIQAEKLYAVKGIGDVLRGDEVYGYNTPPKILDVNKKIFDYLKSKSFSPYILPRASKFHKECLECQGFLCPKNCKIDSYTACIKPALINYNADLITECKVEKLIVKDDRVTTIKIIYNNKQMNIKGNVIILAAGALSTPMILLKSISKSYPNGLSNKSGLVGRNLMRHLIDMYVIKVENNIPNTGFLKEIAMNDLYNHSKGRLGTLQSFGRLPSSYILAENIIDKIAGKIFLPESVFKLFKPILANLIQSYFSNKIILNSIIEDLPYFDNYVTIDSKTQNPRIQYNLHSYEKKIIETSRIEIKNIFKKMGVKLIKQAEDNKRLAHICGTCRAGTNPKTSVVNENCKSHDIKNLYISDSSIFPTSGGTNPGLTIAANALRIADKITK